MKDKRYNDVNNFGWKNWKFLIVFCVCASVQSTQHGILYLIKITLKFYFIRCNFVGNLVFVRVDKENS